MACTSGIGNVLQCVGLRSIFPERVIQSGPEARRRGNVRARTVELVYNNAVEFFAELLTQFCVREVNEGAAFAWCPEWNKHSEALIRMEAIWRAWEHLRLEPPSESVPGG